MSRKLHDCSEWLAIPSSHERLFRHLQAGQAAK
jgi:hypothetical protein